MKLADFDFDLPSPLIAQEPAVPRDSSRLMVLQRPDFGPPEHRRFSDLGAYLQENDVLVVNDTSVIPAKLAASRESGARLEITFLEPVEDGFWEVFVKGGARVKSGERIRLAGGEPATIERPSAPGTPWRVRVEADASVPDILGASGRAPLPPYIKRDPGADPRDAVDREAYQTVFAKHPGAVAAPTAGLHFSDGMVAGLRERGIGVEAVTLHVGAGTFLPVKVDDVDDHEMHAETYDVGAGVVERIEAARAAGGRVIAVGTTSLRALESAAASGTLRPSAGRTRLFVRPGYRFRAVDGLLTNFHLPKSTLLMLVAALTGRERMLAAYREAVRLEYRFFSFGDAMLIL